MGDHLFVRSDLFLNPLDWIRPLALVLNNKQILIGLTKKTITTGFGFGNNGTLRDFQWEYLNGLRILAYMQKHWLLQFG